MSSSDAYSYRGSEGSRIVGVLQIVEDDAGALVLTNNLIRMNVRPEQNSVDATQPVMRWIEARLERECGVTGLSSQIKEICRGVSCEAPSK